MIFGNHLKMFTICEKGTYYQFTSLPAIKKLIGLIVQKSHVVVQKIVVILTRIKGILVVNWGMDDLWQTY